MNIWGGELVAVAGNARSQVLSDLISYHLYYRVMSTDVMEGQIGPMVQCALHNVAL